MLSVIIPAYNASRTLPDCLRALQEQLSGVEEAEIIVVDNNSKDETALIATEAGAIVVPCSRQCAGAARNAGIKVAKGDIICFTDADCVPTANWLSEVSAPLRQDLSLTACKGTYLTKQQELTARFVQLEYEDKYDLMRRHPRIDFIDTYSCAFRTETLVRVGGFDERMTWLEDQELSFRLARDGCEMIFHPTAVVFHRHADTVRGYVRKKYLIGYWKAQVIRLHPERLRKDTHTPQVMKLQMALVMLLPLCLAGALLDANIGFGLFGLVVLAFLVTTVPFSTKALRKDLAVAVASPIFLFLRACALSVGYLHGVLKPQSFTSAIA